MEFSFTDEQTMIFDTAEAFLGEVAEMASIRKSMETGVGYDPSAWDRLCQEMYWQAILIPEDSEGLGLGAVEVVGILERMGKKLYNGPFASSAAVTLALAKWGSSDQKSAYFARLMSGESATIAVIDQARSWSAEAVSAHALQTDEGLRISGKYRFVQHGHTANLILVAARMPGTSGAEGIGLFLVDADAEGVIRHRVPTMDQTRPLAEVQLESVLVHPDQCIGCVGNSAQALAQLLDVQAILITAEQLGGAQASLDMTVDYLQERVQFGRTIASFQAVKHKCADMMLKVEASRSIVYYAACVIDEWLAGRYDANQLAEAASMAKAYSSDAFFFVAGCGIQLFGGVGITEEYDIQLYFKRAKATETFLGGGAEHRERVAQMLLAGEC